MNIHVVRSGDTLWRIARKYNSTIDQISYVNGLEDWDVLVIGQALVVPDPSVEYVVQPGDTLWRISQEYGVPLNELSEHNNIDNPSVIHIGDMLQMPYRTHTVQSGQTLWMIAKQYNINVNAIVSANNIMDSSLIQPGQHLKIPYPTKEEIVVNAYITNYDEEARREVIEIGRHLTYLSISSYSINEDGSLNEIDDDLLLEAARSTNTKPLLVVTNLSNYSFSPDLAASILRNPSRQEILLTNIMNLMKEKGYVGVNFNIEIVYPEDRENLNQFLRRAGDRLHEEGFIISSTLTPKIRADQQGINYEAFDYKAHGEIADFVVVMTYNWGWPGGEPLAISPVNEVVKVLDYAVSVIPRDKILMGFNLYGRVWDIPWQEGTTAVSVDPKVAVELAEEYGANIKYQNTYQAPYFQYNDEEGNRHEVWFEDARSANARYKIVKDYNLRGVSYWALGFKFPQNWPVLQRHFQVKKF